MNNTYASAQEQQGWLSARTLNDAVWHLGDFAQGEKYGYFDASGRSKDTIIEIENKVRNMEIHFTVYGQPYLVGKKYKNNESYSATTVFIESHKMGDLLLDAHYDKTIPLYVTYTSNGYAIVINLLQLSSRPERVKASTYSGVYERVETGTKELLELADAFIYKLDKDDVRLVWKRKK